MRRSMMRCSWVLSCLMVAVVQIALGGRSMIDEAVTSKVQLYLYYESLCPYSAQFIVKGLHPIFNNGLIDVVDLKLFPWGNARIKSDKSFTCQHGPNECLLNTVEACAIDAWPNLNDHFPFVNCVENLILEHKYSHWKICFDKLGLNPKPVEECYPNDKGIQLELKYAAETKALDPPHQYVPWVVVNGKPLYEDYENFTSYVCKAYKGSPPSVCSGVASGSSPRQEAFHSHAVSYTGKASTMAPFDKQSSIAAM